MRKEIDLLPKKKSGEVLISKWLKRLKRGSVVLLSGYGVLLLAIFGARFLVSRQNEMTAQAQVESRTTIEGFAEIESKHALVKSKLQLINRVLSSRRDVNEEMTQILLMLGDDSLVKEVSLMEDGSFRVGAETGNLKAMADAVSKLELNEGGRVRTVEIENVRRNELGIYEFLVLIKT